MCCWLRIGNISVPSMKPGGEHLHFSMIASWHYWFKGSPCGSRSGVLITLIAEVALVDRGVTLKNINPSFIPSLD